MDVLVTGGNGFVGRHLVDALCARGDVARVLALPAEDTSALEQQGISVFRGDVRSPDSIGPAMDGVDAVVHLAAMMDVWRPLTDYRAVNVQGTLNICRAAGAAGARRIVHMSSTSVYGMTRRHAVTEDEPLGPFADPYPVSKAEGDMAVQRLITEEGLPAVIVRPDQIFGPGDRLHFGKTADRLRRNRGVVVGSGGNLLPLVYVTDAVQGLLRALDHPRAVGRAYNIGSDHPITQLEYLRTIARAIGVSPPRIHAPYRALYAAGAIAERVADVAHSQHRPVLTRLGVAFLGTSNRYAIDRAISELGYRPQVELHEAVHLSARWYLDRIAELRTRTPRTNIREGAR